MYSKVNYPHFKELGADWELKYNQHKVNIWVIFLFFSCYFLFLFFFSHFSFLRWKMSDPPLLNRPTPSPSSTPFLIFGLNPPPFRPPAGKRQPPFKKGGVRAMWAWPPLILNGQWRLILYKSLLPTAPYLIIPIFIFKKSVSPFQVRCVCGWGGAIHSLIVVLEA